LARLHGAPGKSAARRLGHDGADRQPGPDRRRRSGGDPSADCCEPASARSDLAGWPRHAARRSGCKEALADDFLVGSIIPADLGSALYVAAALQVYFTRLEASLPASSLRLLLRRGLCPCCDDCATYAKMLYQAQDMGVDPVADDLATLSLDVLAG
jgi:hypothetical protein